MHDELGRTVPISAYANQLITVSREKEEEKSLEKQRRETERKRKNVQKTLLFKFFQFPSNEKISYSKYSKY